MSVTKLPTQPTGSKGRLNRVLMLLDAMSVDERVEAFEEIGLTYCTNLDCSQAGEELPDADSKEPDHECDDEDDDEDDVGGDEGDPDEEDEDEDEEENANDEGDHS